MTNENEEAEIGLARRMARELIKTAKITSYPVLLREVVKHIPDLDIDGQELEVGISGLQITFKGQSYIRYNTTHATTRNRFTVAHEVGHLILGHTNTCNLHNSGAPEEVEANQFAAELIMPLKLLKVAIVTHGTVSSLATAFWVSKDAMGKRVMETGVYKKLKSWQ